MKIRISSVLLVVATLFGMAVSAQSSATISKVIEYRPAPGQHINRLFPPANESDTYEKALAYANSALVGNKKMLGLGAFGGYVIVAFDHSIVNVKGEYDFKGLGNAFPNGAEPGVVMVCQDLNNNGKPDDDEPWYELAGSEYSNESTVHDYEITYYRPDGVKEDVKWTDNKGDEGFVKHISYATQDHIYPNWVSEDKITFKGTKLPTNIVQQGTYFKLLAFDYGYIDNHSNSSSIEQVSFKIDWAVDKDGNNVDLKYIDFVRVHTGQLQEAGLLGETSTELKGIEDLHPNVQIPSGIDKHSNDKLQLLIKQKRLTILGASNVTEIALFDLTGKKCFSIQNQNEAELGKLPNGVYIIRLRLSNNHIIQKKIIL